MSRAPPGNGHDTDTHAHALDLLGEKAPKNDADPSGVSDLRAMAESMDRVAADAAGVELTLPDLKKMRDDYQKMAKDIADSYVKSGRLEQRDQLKMVQGG